MHLVPVIQLENRNCETTLQVNSEAVVAFAWVRRLQNTLKFHKPPWGCQDIQQNVLAIMDLANQAGAFGFLHGRFAVASWLLQFNTLHSSLAIASPVCLSQFSHHCSSLLSSDEDATMLAVYHISSCVVVLSTFECKELCYFQKIQVSSVVACFCYTAMSIIQILFFILQNEYMHWIKILHSCMIHFSCNMSCVKFCDLFWFEIWGAFVDMSNTSRWCKCCCYTWNNHLSL